MRQLVALSLLGLCLSAPVQAGLFADDTAREQVKQLEAKNLTLEESLKQQTKSMLDLLGQIEGLAGEIRKLRGQNEEIAHGLQDAEKRQKDFYIDLDSRLRHFESAEAAQIAASEAAPAVVSPSSSSAVGVPNDPLVTENRAIESAYAILKNGNHAESAKVLREFISKYPDSVHVSNAIFFLGEAQFAQKEILGALSTFQGLRKDFPGSPKAADAYFYEAECYRLLKKNTESEKSLKSLVAKYPNSEAAAKAKKILAGSR